MTLPSIFFHYDMPRQAGLLMFGGLLLLVQGCSPKEVDTAAIGFKSSITIVRETKPEFPAQALASYRELQQRCMEGRAGLAKAQGWTYEPATDAITDAGILALNTQKTEEYFDGAKYAIITTGTQFDSENFGVTQELNCKLLSMPFKSVEIRNGDCHSMNVEYDLSKSTGRRSELKGLCDKHKAPAIDQDGPTVTVAGTGQQCKWNKPDNGNPLHVATCTLLPEPVHAGTGRELLAIRKMTDYLRTSNQPMPGTTSMTIQAGLTIDQATHIDVGGAIPAAKFEFPADSATFGLEKIN